MTIVASIALLLGSAQAQAVAPKPPPPPPCNRRRAEQGIQTDMNICAQNDYRRADQAMNAQWKRTLSVMRNRDRDAAPYADMLRGPGYAQALIRAQRAWIAWRDANCRVEGYAARGGSLEPMLVSFCKTEMTKLRLVELRELARSI